MDFFILVSQNPSYFGLCHLYLVLWSDCFTKSHIYEEVTKNITCEFYLCAFRDAHVGTVPPTVRLYIGLCIRSPTEAISIILPKT
jgi:hypothetical protein